MAHFVLKNAYVSLNSVDLSNDVESVSWPMTTAAEEDTSMGASARTYLVGLNDSTVTLNLRSDYASSQVYATLAGIYAGGAAVPIAIRAVNTTIAATNPEFQGSAILTSYDPVSGSVGSTANTPVEFQVTGAVTHDTSP